MGIDPGASRQVGALVLPGQGWLACLGTTGGTCQTEGRVLFTRAARIALGVGVWMQGLISGLLLPCSQHPLRTLCSGKRGEWWWLRAGWPGGSYARSAGVAPCGVPTDGVRTVGAFP